MVTGEALGKKLVMLGKALILAYIVTALLILLASFIMYKAGMGENQMRIFVMVIYGIASIASGFAYGKARNERRLLSGCIAGILYFAVLVIISAIVNHGFSMDLKKGIISFSICVIGGAVGGIMG